MYKRQLQQLQPQRLGQAAHVVVALDAGGLLRLGAAALDDVGVDRALRQPCLLYTSDAADERSSVDLGGRRIIKKKK